MRKSDGKCEIKITKKGKAELAEFAIAGMRLEPKAPWDGKWRAVVFDIPESEREARDSLRRKFRELGLFQLQQSVFIYPYDVENEVLFIAAYFDVERFIEIFTIEAMLDDRDLQAHFGIKK